MALSIFIGAVGFGICAAVTTTTLFAVAHKQAAHGVATMLISAHKIANTTISYYCTASLLHVDIHVRETMSWWLALARKKMWWWWIAPFGKSYNGDVLQLAKQLFSKASLKLNLRNRCPFLLHLHGSMPSKQSSILTVRTAQGWRRVGNCLTRTTDMQSLTYS